MEPLKVGMREFRARLASYLESDRPIAITRHGEAIGVYVPLRRRPEASDLEHLKAAAVQLDALLAEHGVSEEDLLAEFRQLRQGNG